MNQKHCENRLTTKREKSRLSGTGNNPINGLEKSSGFVQRRTEIVQGQVKEEFRQWEREKVFYCFVDMFMLAKGLARRASSFASKHK